jgi:tripartite-type tricarboxylate transporter receptor subunit TctC
MLRRFSGISRVLAAILSGLLAGSVSAAFPERPLRIMVGQAAGGSSDIISRYVAEAVTPLMGQRIVVENRPGMNGIIGADVVAREQPDGHLIFQCPMSTMAISGQLIGAKVPLDPGAELIPLSNLVLSSYGLVVAPGSPYRSVNDIVAAARAKPGQIVRQSRARLRAASVRRTAQAHGQVDMLHVPYKGGTGIARPHRRTHRLRDHQPG